METVTDANKLLYLVTVDLPLFIFIAGCHCLGIICHIGRDTTDATN